MSASSPHIRLTHREAQLEQQVRELESQVHGLSSLVADKLMQIDRLEEQVETLRELNNRVIGERDKWERDFIRLEEQLEAEKQRLNTFERRTEEFIDSQGYSPMEVDELLVSFHVSFPATMSERTKADAPLEGRGGRAIRGSSGESAVANPFDSEQASSVPNPAKTPYVYSGDVNDPGPHASNQESKP